MELLSNAVEHGDLDYIKNNIKRVRIGDTESTDYLFLNKALEFKQIDVAKFLVQKNVQVNRPADAAVSETTPLHRAVCLKNIDFIQILLKKGASIVVKNEDGDTPLHLAAKMKQSNIVDLLTKSIETFADFIIADEHGLTHMHIACTSKHFRIVKNFLNQDCNVNAFVEPTSPDFPGFTPLHFAVSNKSMGIASLLCQKGAGLDIVDANGDTPLHLAFKKNNHSLLKILFPLDFKFGNITNNDGISLFHIACSLNEITIIRNLSKFDVNVNEAIPSVAAIYSGYTPLHIAVKFGCDLTVKWLLEKKANIMVKSVDEATPLHLAFYETKNVIIDLILSAHYETCGNPADKNGITHLHIACMRDDQKLIEKLMIDEAEVNCVIKKESKYFPGYTPLHIAVYFTRYENAKILLAHKADVNAKEIQGLIPLHLACKGSDDKLSLMKKTVSDVIKSDLYNGHNTGFICSKLEISAIVNLLLNYKGDVNAKDNMGKIPLFYFYKNKDYYSKLKKMLKSTLDSDHELDIILKHIYQSNRLAIFSILQNPINLKVMDNDGFSILHYVASFDSYFKDLHDLNKMIIKLLINKGADVNAVNKQNQTPLLLSIRNKCFDFMEIILEEKVNVNIAESDTLSTPFHEYLESWNSNRYDPTIRKFIDAGANVNAQDKGLNTPLHCVNRRYAFVISILLDYGLDINIKNVDGQTPLTNMKSWDTVLLKVFVNHMTKLKMIGYTFIKENELFISKALEEHPFSYYNDENLIITEKDCQEELEKLKNIHVNINLSLYHILFKNVQQITYCLNSLREIFEQYDSFENHFPIYGQWLKTQYYSRALLRRPLFAPAIEFLQNLSQSKLPEMCIEMIFEYLSNEDLANLAKVKPILPGKKTKKRAAIAMVGVRDVVHKRFRYCGVRSRRTNNY